MKQIKLLIFLIVFTGIVATVALYYSWYTKKDHIEELTYIPDTYWLQLQQIPAVNSSMYDCVVDEAGIAHIVWAVQCKKGSGMEIRHLALNKDGEVRSPATILQTNPRIADLVIELAAGRLKVYWIGQGSGERLNLYESTASLEGRALGLRTLLTNEFLQAADLNMAKAPDGGRLLLWTDQQEWTAKRDEVRYLKALVLKADGKVGRVQQVVVAGGSASLPKLALDQRGGYHLVWCERVYQDSVKMYYQHLQADGTAEGRACLIDQGKISAISTLVAEGRFWVAWAKEKNEFYRVADILGTVLELNNPGGPHKIVKLTRDGANYSPALGLDEAKNIRLLYIKNKNNYKNIVHQTYQGDFTHEIGIAQWMSPESYPAEKVEVYRDPAGHLHVACLEIGDHTTYSLHYTNSVARRTVTPLQIIGFNAHNYKRSLVFNTIYTLVAPFFDLVIFANFFALFMSIVFTSLLYGMIYRMVMMKRLGAILERYYVALVVLGLVQMGTFFGILTVYEFIWPLELAWQHFWFVFGLPWLGALILSRVMKLRETEIMNATFTLIPWDYWLWLILMILNMPSMNYIIPPALA